ncbi:uncharacterized protein MELLADRAFT_113006 [Melampsora larici-populina 98AG31]|uniref:Uncharacterized protein n=1 Tax=Melampsora larici-populina (strain 98AG31 / pathotype 3-4-7) TaxID=747676 RepID=F4S8E2_MELLP|nr:uncharacterized protein MELLADRAFT_113006 [Melampsora larici-populina 98AG31]EGF99082.1 hypothetical protein MELLADRAFT_113006 [Melampsora larici-populina 98AG31]
MRELSSSESGKAELVKSRLSKDEGRNQRNVFVLKTIYKAAAIRTRKSITSLYILRLYLPGGTLSDLMIKRQEFNSNSIEDHEDKPIVKQWIMEIVLGLHTSLGVWLVDAVRDSISGSNGNSIESNSSKKRPESYPCVIANFDEIRYCHLVLNMAMSEKTFQEAAQTSGARARHDRFEEGVIEVRKYDLMSFGQKLHLSP